MTIQEKVQRALEDPNCKFKSLLTLVNFQLKGAVRSRKSGDDLTDEKAADIINRTIKSVKDDRLLSNGSEELAEQKIKLLQSFL